MVLLLSNGKELVTSLHLEHRVQLQQITQMATLAGESIIQWRLTHKTILLGEVIFFFFRLWQFLVYGNQSSESFSRSRDCSYTDQVISADTQFSHSIHCNRRQLPRTNEIAPSKAYACSDTESDEGHNPKLG